MNRLTNEDGNLLVILIIGIVLISALGVGFVSMVSSKNEGYGFLLNGQRANMIAKAGLEWAIRYISDGLSDKESNYYKNKDHYQPATSLPYAGGSFTVKWTYNLSDITNDALEITASFRGAEEKITLTNFRKYLSLVTLPPTNNAGDVPSQTPYTLYTTVIGNSDTNIQVNRISIIGGQADQHLQQICIVDKVTKTVIDTVFKHTDKLFSPNCGSPPCLDTSGADKGVYLSTTIPAVITVAKGLKQHHINAKTTTAYSFVFDSSSPVITSRIQVQFNDNPVYLWVP